MVDIVPGAGPLEGEAFREYSLEHTQVTEDDMPVIIYAHSMPEDTVSTVTVAAVAISDISSEFALGERTAVFGRARGTLGRLGVTALESKLTTLPAPQPDVLIERNGGDLTIDIAIVGKAAMPLRWHVRISIRETR